MGLQRPWHGLTYRALHLHHWKPHLGCWPEPTLSLAPTVSPTHTHTHTHTNLHTPLLTICTHQVSSSDPRFPETRSHCPLDASAQRRRNPSRLFSRPYIHPVFIVMSEISEPFFCSKEQNVRWIYARPSLGSTSLSKSAGPLAFCPTLIPFISTPRTSRRKP